MRIAVRAMAIVALLAGGVFFFQGIGIIPGSFMTGRNEWAIIGAALALGAVAVLGLSVVSSRVKR